MLTISMKRRKMVIYVDSTIWKVYIAKKESVYEGIFMKIKLAILETDRMYLERIVSVFNTKYADKFEVYSFTDMEVALATIESSKIDVLIASDAYDVKVDKLPRRCGFAYFVDSTDVETVREQRAICKFQKIDLIYKQILSIYSENAGDVIGMKVTGDNCKTVAFIPASGGVGASTMAAAAAIHWASQGKKTLYLNFETFGSSDTFFTGEGQFGMSDIIYALKSRKTNLAMKLESCIKQDKSGVYFYSQPNLALDLIEMTSEEKIRLLSEINIIGSYDVVVIDMAFRLDKAHMEMYQKMNALILVGDGSELSNVKLHRVVTALQILEEGKEEQLMQKMALIYNKFSNKTCKVLDELEIQNIGGAPRYEHASVAQILAELSAMNMFDNIF